MQTIAMQVHNKIAQQMFTNELLFNEETLLNKEQEEIYESVLKFGGRSVENVQEYLKKKEKNKVVVSLNDLKKKVSELQLDPRWKIITYGSLMGILGDHNLVLGPLTKYIKEIPEGNIKKMIEYSKITRTEYTLQAGVPIFNFDKSYYSDNLLYNDTDRKFYVCASVDNFEKQNRAQIGQEIFYDASLKPKFELEIQSPDPIIISPLIFKFKEKKFLLIDVVTSWDREAGLIVNEMAN